VAGHYVSPLRWVAVSGLSRDGVTIATMGRVGWLVLAGVVIATVTALWRRRGSGGRGGDVEVGPVSDAWLAEQRGRKDS
jgi:hypothetical protein